MKYTRTNIYLLEQDKRELEEIAEKEGKKFSELVRVIMRNYINKTLK
jgi:metal-responsive CopG/Arc/MetJ family transcriptional regulator